MAFAILDRKLKKTGACLYFTVVIIIAGKARFFTSRYKSIRKRGAVSLGKFDVELALMTVVLVLDIIVVLVF